MALQRAASRTPTADMPKKHVVQKQVKAASAGVYNPITGACPVFPLTQGAPAI